MLALCPIYQYISFFGDYLFDFQNIPNIFFNFLCYTKAKKQILSYLLFLVTRTGIEPVLPP